MTTPQTTAPPTRLLSVAEIAKRLSVGKRTVYNLRYRGGFPKPIQIAPNTIRWREADLERWIASRSGATGEVA